MTAVGCVWRAGQNRTVSHLRGHTTVQRHYKHMRRHSHATVQRMRASAGLGAASALPARGVASQPGSALPPGLNTPIRARAPRPGTIIPKGLFREPLIPVVAAGSGPQLHISSLPYPGCVLQRGCTILSRSVVRNTCSSHLKPEQRPMSDEHMYTAAGVHRPRAVDGAKQPDLGILPPLSVAVVPSEHNKKCRLHRHT